VARIVPVEKEKFTAGELAAVLRRVQLSPAEARAWHADLRRARKMLKPAVNRWNE